MWLKSLQHHFKKKRTQPEPSSPSLTAEEGAADGLHSPKHASTDEEEYESRPKRRSVSIDVAGLPPTGPPSACDRRPSLEQWHEARRARNSLEGQGTTTTDRLTICKAGSTTIVNKTYITIKHLGSGTFGRVMLCFNVYDQRLYAIKVCRKSQFASSMSRMHSNSRLRRSMAAGGSYSSLPSPSSSSCFTAGRSCGGGAGSAAMLPGVSGGSMSSPTTAAGNASSCAISCGGALHSTQGVTNICATSGSSSMVGAGAAAAASAAAAAALFGCGSGGGGGARGSFAFPAPGAAWPAASPTIWQLQQPQMLGAGQQLPPQPPSPPSPPSFAADAQQQQQLALPVQPRSSASPVFGHMGSRSGPLPPPPHPGALLSSGSQGGGVGVLMGTDCSTGSLSGGSVFQEALMRFQTEELVKEIAILKKLHHPNIVNLVEVIDDPSTDSLLLVMEYVEGGTLQPRQVKPGHWELLPEREVWRYVREVLQGLDYLHAHKVVHGDLKPANLLLDSNSGKVKIADFGSSIMAGSDKIFSMRNCPGFSTPAFRSPESLTSGYQPSFEMDMWALGVCIYIWVFGCLPFTGGAPFIIYEKIRAQDISMPSAPDVSPELRDFVCQLLDKDVLKRLDVQRALQHPWVTLGGSAPLVSIRQRQGPHPAGVAGASSGLCGSLEATQEEIDAAIKQIASGGVSELMDVVFAERVLQPGQQLIAPGQAADCIYLISHGELEIYSPVGGSGSGEALSLSEPLISGLDLAHLTEQQADAEMWDTNTVSDISKEPGGDTDIMMLSDVLAPWDSSRGMLPPDGLKLLAVKGPGDSLGVPLLPTSTAAAAANGTSRRSSSGAAAVERVWKVSVVARGRTTVFTARLEDLARLVEAHPEMEGAVKQIVTQQETDMMVAEAMRQLQLYNDCHRSHPSHPACTDVHMSWQQEVRQPAA